MTVWDDLIGQDAVVAQLKQSVQAANEVVSGGVASGGSSAGMTHAWLLTGPPGSGRSNAARALAAALLCTDGASGCGACLACRTALAGSNADVTTLSTDQLSIGVDAARELVRHAALKPSGGKWQVMIVEDADRLTDSAADALLKAIEEPPPRTVWVLCAPTVEDVLPTIRSRCRSVILRTPPTAAVASHLVARDGVTESVAMFAARASQGHIGRARALARDEATRDRRREVLRIPGQLKDLGDCMAAAQRLVETAEDEAAPRTLDRDSKEVADLEQTYGVGTRGIKATGYNAAHKELERQQKQRAKRFVRDSIDRALLDLASYYRDVLTIQLRSQNELINEEMRSEIATMARNTTGELSTQRLDVIFATREALEGEVAPVLALESLMISLRGKPDDRY